MRASFTATNASSCSQPSYTASAPLRAPTHYARRQQVKAATQSSSSSTAQASINPWPPQLKATSQPRDTRCYAGFGFGAGAKAASKSKQCPCGSGKQYADCCQRFIKPKNKTTAPETPEQLIAARYSAFREKDPKFLKRTNHRNNPALQGSKTAGDAGVKKSCTYEEDLAMTMVAVDFVDFKILANSSSGSSSSSSSATVDYQVTFKRKIDSQGQKIAQPAEEVLCERATVVKDEEGRWLVLGVEQIQPAAAAAP